MNNKGPDQTVHMQADLCLCHSQKGINRFYRDMALMSLIMRKPVFRVCDQVRIKPACSASETS